MTAKSATTSISLCVGHVRRVVPAHLLHCPQGSGIISPLGGIGAQQIGGINGRGGIGDGAGDDGAGGAANAGSNFRFGTRVIMHCRLAATGALAPANVNDFGCVGVVSSRFSHVVQHQ